APCAAAGRPLVGHQRGCSEKVAAPVGREGDQPFGRGDEAGQSRRPGCERVPLDCQLRDREDVEVVAPVDSERARMAVEWLPGIESTAGARDEPPDLTVPGIARVQVSLLDRKSVV